MVIKIRNDSVEGLSIDNADSNDGEHDVELIKKNENKNDGDNVRLTQSNIKTGSENHTIMILGNHNTRGCANKIKVHLNKNFNITGVMKPGSDVLTLTVSAKDAIEELTKNDASLYTK
jgi:hypothetical protein